jgi:hypothetical protein
MSEHDITNEERELDLQDLQDLQDLPTVKMEETPLPKYSVRGADGKIYQTDDLHLLVISYLAADTVSTPYGLSFSIQMRPDDCQPSGSCNFSKVKDYS